MKINAETKFEVGREVFLIKKRKKVIETKLPATYVLELVVFHTKDMT
ncbi:MULTISPECIES: hypothetical protein [unclassified Eubacterium (in: firmicutes)]|nr:MULTISPECIES: hypothetical protein [unclassified Eubacterium (in: firmicutes)]